LVRSFHDLAYDGLFQNQYGWGVLEANESDEKRILDLVKVWSGLPIYIHQLLSLLLLKGKELHQLEVQNEDPTKKS